MSLRDRPVTKWSPTVEDPLNGCRDVTRRMYALIVAEPGIAQHVAAKRAGVTDASQAVGSLINRDLVEVRQDDRYLNYLWPVSP